MIKVWGERGMIRVLIVVLFCVAAIAYDISVGVALVAGSREYLLPVTPEIQVLTVSTALFLWADYLIRGWEDKP